MPRLFSGLELPVPVRQQLSLLKSPLPGAKWVEAENLHLTLRFAGDIDNLKARDFADALGHISQPPFELQLQGLGVFGGKMPTSLWAAVAPNPALLDLARANERAARKAGLPPLSRKFTGHVTLARFKHTRVDRIARFLERNGAFMSIPFFIDSFVLFSARPRTGGGPYVVEQTFPLNFSSARTLEPPVLPTM